MEGESRDKSTKELIVEMCQELQKTLLDKNAKYGNSAFNNGIVFDVPPLTALKARINDKASRIKASLPGDEEDAVLDLIGYLILYKIKEREDNGNIF